MTDLSRSRLRWLRPAAGRRHRIILIAASPAARLTIWAVGIYAVWQGIGIARGGDDRWTSPSFAVLRSIPNPTLTWGTLLTALGVALLTASLLRWWWLKAVALGGIALWSALFAAGALRAAQMVPTAATTGGKTYALILVIAVILIWVDEKHPIKPEQVFRAA